MKRPRHEADHSPPYSAKIKNGEAVLPLPHVFMAWCLIKHRNNIMFPYHTLSEMQMTLGLSSYRHKDFSISLAWTFCWSFLIVVLCVAVYETKLGCNSTGWNNIWFLCNGLPRECVEGSQHEVTISPYVYKSLPFVYNRHSQQGCQVPYLLTCLLTYRAEPFLRSCQLCSHSRTSQLFKVPEGSSPCSQGPSVWQ
jgi:hypothetical protein